MSFDIEIEGIPDEKKLSRQLKKPFREAVRGALQVVGDTWTRDIAPKHFTKQGKKEYDYQPRTRKYVFRKIREYARGKKGGAIEPATPLVYTGRTRNRVLTMTKFRPVKDRESAVQVARGTINAPALNFRRSGKSPNMREEVTAISTADTEVLRGVFVREFNVRFTKR